MAPSTPKTEAKPKSPSTTNTTSAFKPAKKKETKTTTNPFLVAASVFVIVGAYTVYRYLQPLEPFSPLPALDTYFAKSGFGQYGKTLSVVFPRTGLTGGGSSGAEESLSSAAGANAIDILAPKLQIKKQVKAKTEPLLSIPRSQIIDIKRIIDSEAGKLIAYNNATHLKALGDITFQTIFYFAYFLMYERRKGKDSEFFGWFQSLPTDFSHEGGALYWPEHIANCLDRISAAEFIAINTVVGTTVQGANVCCNLSKDAVTNAGASVCEAMAKGTIEPFTDEEARWAISIYLRYNYNDQAIIPGLNFFKRSNKEDGILTQETSKDEKFIHVYSPKDLNEGDEAPVWNYARSPGSSLVVNGFFENATDAMDFPFRLPQAKPGSLVFRACHEHVTQLVFTADGKPTQQLLTCMAALLGTTPEHQKSNLQKLRQNDPLTLVDVYGNLTLVTYRHGMSLVNASQSEQCSLHGMTPEHEQMVLNYLSYSNKFFNTATEYLFEETDRLSRAAGIPSRLKPPKDEDETETEGQQQEPTAGDAYEDFSNKAEEEVEDGLPQAP